MTSRTTPSPVDGLDRALLTPVVCHALQRPTLLLEFWQVQPIAGLLNVSTSGVYSVAGAARDHEQLLDWSLVLKVVCAPDGAAGDDWRREALAYQSGLLDQLGGDLRAPRCFGAVAQTGGRCYWIWLEDLTDAYGGRWPVARYGLAARHLGSFNGAYVRDQPVPAYPWLSRGGMGAAGDDPSAALALVEDAETWTHPLVRHAVPASLAQRLSTAIVEAERFRAALRHLPQTLCHGDAAFFNLVAQREADGTEHTIALDLARVGSAALGEEISVLIWPSVTEFQVAVSDLAQLEAEVLAGYMAGLRVAGWNGDVELVEAGVTLHAVLRWCSYPMVLALAIHDEQHRAMETFFGRSMTDIVEVWAGVTERLLDRMDAVQLRLP